MKPTKKERDDAKARLFLELAGVDVDPAGWERFWAKLTLKDGHWLWTGAKLPKGHGLFKPTQDGPTLLTHRIAWTLLRGDPGTQLVIHKVECRHHECANPDHLFVGDRKDAANARGQKHRRR